MKEFIVVLLLFIQYSQLQEITTLFNCTFDHGLIDDCIFHGLLSLGDTLEVDEGQNAIDLPDRPMSDATSVFSPTTNGDMCIFPYELNGWDMHFCRYDENTTDYRCPTESGDQTCAKGQYGYKTTDNPTGYFEIYKSTVMIVTNTTDEAHCLRFYYYFTDNLREQYINFRIHPNSNMTQSGDIVFVRPNDENKWYYSQTSFTPITDEYYLVFVLYRSRELNDTTSFTFALDNISVTSGSCFHTSNDTVTTDSSILNETFTVPTIHTTKKKTTMQSVGTSMTTKNRENTTTMKQTTTTTTMQQTTTTTTMKQTTTTTTMRRATTTTIIKQTTTTTMPSFTTSPSTYPRVTSTTTKPTVLDSTTTSLGTTTTVIKSKNLGLILGLSLGIGAPALFAMIVIAIYIVKSMH